MYVSTKYPNFRRFADKQLSAPRSTFGRYEDQLESSFDSDTSSLVEPSENPISTSLPNHKDALQRVTNYKQEQPIDIDPNTILHNSLMTTNFMLLVQKKLGRVISLFMVLVLD
jgi:hypothetical protein